MKKNLLFALSIFLKFQLLAQPVPAPKQTQAIVINGGTLHVGNGQVLENQSIAIKDGKIELINGAQAGKNFAGYKEINAKGKHIYPGFIAPGTNLGLVEIESIRATIDNVETGYLNPNARAIIAYNTDSEVTPTIRNNGTLMAQIIPSGGLISGQSSIVQLDAWNWEDAAYKTDEGLMMNWPSNYSGGGWWAEPSEIKKEDKYKEYVQNIVSLFEEASAYAKKTNVTEKNLRLEAMHGLFDGSKKLYINVAYAKGISEAVLFAKRFGITPVIVGGEDAWLLTEFLKEQKVSVVLQRVQSLPLRNDDAIDQPYRNAAILAKAGIPFCFSMDGAWQQRNLPFQAGQSIGYGLAYEDAVKALTLDAAKILGISTTCGSIEQGKDATLFISEGDALDMRTNKVTYAMIQGRVLTLDDKQKGLYKRFSEKYKQK
jgi:imidazolonepropionase-like amidohydrolase